MSSRGRGRGGAADAGRDAAAPAAKEATQPRKAGLFARDCACTLAAAACASPLRTCLSLTCRYASALPLHCAAVRQAGPSFAP
jgi:hypothetical protein